MNAQNCSQVLGAVSYHLYEKPSGYYVPRTTEQWSILDQVGATLLSDLFELQLLLRDRFDLWTETEAKLDPACVQSVKRSYVYLRFIQEQVMGLLANRGRLQFSNAWSFTAKKPFTLTNPKYLGALDFRVGDLVLMRGSRFSSAMIARLGDEAAQFSHLAIVGADEAGKLYLVEALIEFGTVITPIEKFLKAKEARLAIFRAKDRELAERAGRSILKYVLDYKRQHKGKTIPYDFAMDDGNSEQLYCSELIQLAFKQAGAGSLPRFKSSFFKFKDAHFLRQELGVKSESVFAPSDIELDNRFELVAEFKDVSMLRRLAVGDAFFSAFYTWVQKANYTLTKDYLLQPVGYVAKAFLNLGWGKGFADPQIPGEKISQMLRMSFAFDRAVDDLVDYDKTFIRNQGYSPSMKELLSHIEDFRQEDCRKQHGLMKINYGRGAGKLNPVLHQRIYSHGSLVCPLERLLPKVD